MNLVENLPKDLIVVFVIDPLDLNKLSLDNIREKNMFDMIATSPVGIILGKPEELEVVIELTKITFKDSNKEEFEKRKLFGIIKQVLENLGKIKINAYGINIDRLVKLADCNNAGEWIRDKFLKDQDQLETVLGNEIFANSTRIFYGTPEKHYDLRITPISFTNNEIVLRHHLHVDVSNVDISKIDVLLKKELKSQVGNLNEVINKL